MHVCLRVDEIVRAIASELVASYKGSIDGVALARCCKSFEDPALDAMWEAQDNLIPLLKTLPRDVWDKEECVRFLKYPPTPLELTRFRKYARRMRTLKLTGGPYRLPPHVFAPLQYLASNEPLLPRIKALYLWFFAAEFAPLIPSCISPGTASLSIDFDDSNLTVASIAMTITAIQARCPDLRKIAFFGLPRDQIITAAVTKLLVTTNQNALRSLDIHSALTAQAREVVHKLPNLTDLTVVVEENTPMLPLVHPSLPNLTIMFNHDRDYSQVFREARLEKLKSMRVFFTSEMVGDFLEEFARTPLAASAKNTLSDFQLFADFTWNPDYSPLLSFTQLTRLTIESPCTSPCSSNVNDDTVIDLARAMPKLVTLHLGYHPCRNVSTGITVRGLVALAHHCSHLEILCVHFRVYTLSTPPATPLANSRAIPPPLRDCALTDLLVGETPMPRSIASRVAMTLFRIFPRLTDIVHRDDGWEEVLDAIHLSREIVDSSRATIGGGI